MKYLKIFTDFLDAMAPLSDGAAGRLFRAMLTYARDGTAPTLKGKEAVLWIVARQHMDREAAAYEGKVEARREAGRKGAEVRWQRVAAHGKASQDKDKEKENDKDKDKDKESVCRGAPLPLTPGSAAASRSRMTPPSLEEIEIYCRERGNQVNAQRFLDFYTANGWQIGKVPMKDWQAAVRSWESNGVAEKAAPTREKSSRETFLTLMEQARMEEANQL